MFSRWSIDLHTLTVRCRVHPLNSTLTLICCSSAECYVAAAESGLLAWVLCSVSKMGSLVAETTFSARVCTCIGVWPTHTRACVLVLASWQGPPQHQPWVLCSVSKMGSLVAETTFSARAHVLVFVCDQYTRACALVFARWLSPPQHQP